MVEMLAEKKGFQKECKLGKLWVGKKVEELALLLECMMGRKLVD